MDRKGGPDDAADAAAASSLGLAPRSGLLVDKKKLAEQKAELDAEAKKDGGAAAGHP